MADSLQVKYTGPSMYPTLAPGDLLVVQPGGGRRVRIGDILVFHPPDGAPCVVHRVTARHARGFRTRGDNNALVDPYTVTAKMIVGRVVAVQRRGVRLSISLGWRGYMTANLRWGMKSMARVVSRMLHPFYRWLAGTGFLRNALPTRFKPRVLGFNRPGGRELQLLMGHRVVGRRSPRDSRWQIARPFRLFIDEACLPGDDSSPSV